MGSGNKTPLELALEREAAGEIDYCDECEYVVAIRGVGYCGISGKLLLPMMFERGLGSGPARRCRERKEARDMGLNGADLARLGPAAQRQVLEKLGKQVQEKERKYHNEPESRGKLRFDSKKEARRYDELMVMLREKMIRGLQLQKQFTLQESYVTPEGKRVRAIRYVADFCYEQRVHCCILHDEGPSSSEVRWELVVEDVKSRATRTAQYEIKKKLMLERFGVSITEV